MEANIYYPDEIIFLKKNFFSMTNQQLLDEINLRRTKPLRLPGLIHQCRRLGLKREIQIRWSGEDTKFLIRNYLKFGNVELAEMLTARKKTFRIINGKKVFRVFTKKHVEKKIKLLKLQRSEEVLIKIKRRNIETGRQKSFRSNDNLWTRGVKTAAAENNIKIWRKSGHLCRVIKIDGRYIPYTRWFYHNFIEAITDDLKVYHIDLDPINDDPENLEARPYSGISLLEYQRALPLIQQRLKNHLKITWRYATTETREQEKEWQKQLRHLQKLEKAIKSKIELMVSRNNSIHLKRRKPETSNLQPA